MGFPAPPPAVPPKASARASCCAPKVSTRNWARHWIDQPSISPAFPRIAIVRREPAGHADRHEPRSSHIHISTLPLSGFLSISTTTPDAPSVFAQVAEAGQRIAAPTGYACASAPRRAPRCETTFTMTPCGNSNERGSLAPATRFRSPARHRRNPRPSRPRSGSVGLTLRRWTDAPAQGASVFTSVYPKPPGLENAAQASSGRNRPSTKNDR